MPDKGKSKKMSSKDKKESKIKAFIDDNKASVAFKKNLERKGISVEDAISKMMEKTGLSRGSRSSVSSKKSKSLFKRLMRK